VIIDAPKLVIITPCKLIDGRLHVMDVTGLGVDVGKSPFYRGEVPLAFTILRYALIEWSASAEQQLNDMGLILLSLIFS
jgi:predicted Zn-dependent protease with MMP-like domain